MSARSGNGTSEKIVRECPLEQVLVGISCAIELKSPHLVKIFSDALLLANDTTPYAAQNIASYVEYTGMKLDGNVNAQDFISALFTRCGLGFSQFESKNADQAMNIWQNVLVRLEI